MSDQAVNGEIDVAVVSDAVVQDDTADIGAAYDRIMVQNGSDRGEDGKFTSANGEQADQQNPAELQQPAEPAPASAAPAHLPQAIKADWEKIPETARAAIVAHQTEMDRKFGEVGKQLGEWKPLGERLTAVKNEFPEYFADSSPTKMAQSAAELAIVQAKLTKDPVGTLMQIMQVYGATDAIRSVLSGQQPTGESQNIQQLQQTIRGLQQKLDEVGNPDFIGKHVEGILSQRETQTLVGDLSKDKPFYADVEADLPVFIEKAWGKLGETATKKAVFDLAYDMAVNADPDTRAKAKAAEAKATAAIPDPKRTEQARRAASINVKSTSSGGDRQLSEQEALASAWDRAMAN